MLKHFKKLEKGLKKTGGRNNTGKITVRHRGGGHKRKYYKVDFKSIFVYATILFIKYDPNRSSSIAGIQNSEGAYSYILLTTDSKVGDIIHSVKSENVPIKNGNRLFLKDILIGSFINNISLDPNKGGIYARSAGTYGILVQKNLNGKVRVKLPSKEEVLISENCLATLGVVSNVSHSDNHLRKAGQKRWLGRRPKVRGVAMNPVDHPHGGGEGKTSGGRPSVSIWGRLTKGKPTRRNKKNAHIFLSRKKIK